MALLARHGCFGLMDLRDQSTGIQPRKHLPLLDPVSFLDENLRDTFAAVERQGCLPKIDIAVENQRRIVLRTMHIPPCPRGCDASSTMRMRITRMGLFTGNLSIGGHCSDATIFFAKEPHRPVEQNRSGDGGMGLNVWCLVDYRDRHVGGTTIICARIAPQCRIGRTWIPRRCGWQISTDKSIF